MLQSDFACVAACSEVLQLTAGTPLGKCPKRASGALHPQSSMQPRCWQDSCSAVCPSMRGLSPALRGRAGSHWQKGTLVGKPGAMFTSTATQGGELFA